MVDSVPVEIGKTFGVEIEVVGIPVDRVRSSNILSSLGLKVVHDASVESKITSINKGKILVNNKAKNILVAGRNQTCGAELVSGIRGDSLEESIDTFRTITEELAFLGEPSQNYRAGIHYHISMSPSLKINKAIIRLGSHLEQVFFYVGGMGYEFRGITNDFAYCRPITEELPLYVPLVNEENKYVPSFNTTELLNSTKMIEFWHKYGDSWNLRGTRYVPIRYHWLNLYPLLSLGTLEFRVFNFSLNPKYLFAALNLSKAFSEYCLNTDYKRMKGDELLNVNSIGMYHNKEHVLKTLNRFAKIVELDALTLEILQEIITYTPPIKMSKDKKVICHLRRMPTLWTNGYEEYAPTKYKVSVKETKKARVADSHALRENHNAVELRLD